MTQAAESTTLRRTGSHLQIVGMALNDVVGSGVYLLPAAAAALLGFASLWAVALAAVAVLLVVLCFAEASSYFDQPGGAYLYARTAFGEFVGFQVGWMTWLARVASVASLSVGFSEALSFLVPAAGSGLGQTAAITTAILMLAAINIVGVRAGISTSMVLVVSKLLPLVLFLAVGLFFVSTETALTQQVTEPGGLGGAALLLLFAYAGFENTPAAAGEYRNPKRDVPRALVLHLVVVSALYIAVQWVALGTLSELGRSTAPLSDAAQLFLGPWGATVLALGAVVSILGTVANSVLVGPRYLYALAVDGYGPAWIGRVHPRFRTPATAILVQTAIALPLALSGSFTGLAALSVVARLTTYIGTAAALPRLRQQARRTAQQTQSGSERQQQWQLPFGVLIPLLAILVSVGLLASAEWRNLVAATLALAVGAAIYAARTRRA